MSLSIRQRAITPQVSFQHLPRIGAGGAALMRRATAKQAGLGRISVQALQNRLVSLFTGVTLAPWAAQ